MCGLSDCPTAKTIWTTLLTAPRAEMLLAHGPPVRLLRHYLQCKDTSCPVCTPVMDDLGFSVAPLRRRSPAPASPQSTLYRAPTPELSHARWPSPSPPPSPGLHLHHPAHSTLQRQASDGRPPGWGRSPPPSRGGAGAERRHARSLVNFSSTGTPYDRRPLASRHSLRSNISLPGVDDVALPPGGQLALTSSPEHHAHLEHPAPCCHHATAALVAVEWDNGGGVLPHCRHGGSHGSSHGSGYGSPAPPARSGGGGASDADQLLASAGTFLLTALMTKGSSAAAAAHAGSPRAWDAWAHLLRECSPPTCENRQCRCSRTILTHFVACREGAASCNVCALMRARFLRPHEGDADAAVAGARALAEDATVAMLEAALSGLSVK
ncbi:hypothetical protein FOA52_008041 [Chlamydomonas sp. UWO 241]|nr:hypothetical protein FOA52_008041 [Chlamydomonas sp. UWO 241]